MPTRREILGSALFALLHNQARAAEQTMERDGRTPYGVACMTNFGEKAVVYVGPQGDLARHVHHTYTERAGPFAVFEHFWQLTQCRPEFFAVAAA
ncbi:hypothetical protein [Bradyrhizobium sp. RD5-C2]|uniref:hypothetical protein n=1 Tax=Bradyrhizobium sp. RD5-C2 TaxID=244562 RepID=UPI001CC5CB5F|nr:hypothetical protein [Bradyrhizobium sp. RD5-C2]GIQ77066.1 hypothetical protein BraRD5C2_55140 [Bradyrhizobium sp. RD5-C2]